MDVTHGKYLAVDYGDKRTGLADCDLSGQFAGAIGTIRESGMRHTAERVAKEAAARGCRRIIVGLPKNMDGSEGERAETVRIFASMLAQFTDLPIDFSDERMTTMTAYRYLDASGTYGKKRKEAIDALSAELILQSYLDRERAENAKKSEQIGE